MTEREKMLRGEPYDPRDPELTAARLRARQLMRAFERSSPADPVERDRILRELLGSAGENVEIEPPFYCDYGGNIRVGSDVFINFGCVVLDVARVTIGDRVLLGPAVQIYTAAHPMSARERRSGLEWGKPIEIGSDAWIGGGAILLPGVTIGAGAVVGAGSVVTRSVPARVLAVGNPCSIVRPLPD